MKINGLCQVVRGDRLCNRKAKGECEQCGMECCHDCAQPCEKCGKTVCRECQHECISKAVAA
jgi:hypothetical protein